MSLLIYLLCIAQAINIGHGEINSKSILENLSLIETNTMEEHGKSNVTNRVNGTEPVDETALLLTPLIEQGWIAEAVNASRVDPALFLGVQSYSGFLTVNNTHKSHLFFWYFPSFTKPVNETPWIIWLQGGPGSSSMNGLFQEIGPFAVDSSGVLYKNPYTWLMNHSLVFIDNPVGTGFSFTEHKDGYAKDMATYGAQLHTCVRQLVQLFPELRVAPLFVAGESYAGKYVPALAREIHSHKDSPGMGINFKGLIIGNGFIEPEMTTQSYKAYQQFGLVEKYQIDTLEFLIDRLQTSMNNNWTSLAFYDYITLHSQLMYLSRVYGKEEYNYLRKEPLFTGHYTKFLNKSEVRCALHVGDREFNMQSSLVMNYLIPADFLTTTRPLIEDLLEHYRVLAFCGSLDLMIPCVVSSERIRAFQWTNRQQFLEAERNAFYFNNTRVGFFTSGGGLTWAVFVGVGHMVSGEAPAQTQTFITRYTRDMPQTS